MATSGMSKKQKTDLVSPLSGRVLCCPNGFDCREPCCIIPPKTPSDEESPVWARKLEMEQESSGDDEPSCKELPMPLSPPTPSFTPSDCSTAERNFCGRYALRIMAGQDPKKNPELFTPRVDARGQVIMIWPDNDWVPSEALLHGK